MQNLADADYRKEIIDEMLGTENRRRKDLSFRRFEIYNKKQEAYIEQKLQREFPDTHASMRKIKSINIAPKIINSTSCVYKDDPTRTFFDSEGQDLSDDQSEQIRNLYLYGKVNERLNRSNRIKKVQNQCILQVVPRNDRLELRAYHPHQLDCVPMEDDPTTPFAYAVFDYVPRASTIVPISLSDGINQKIADRDDAIDDDNRAKMRIVLWSAEHNLIVDGFGNIVQDDPTDIENPLGELPFYDLSDDKEGCFWVDKGSNTIEFAIDFAVMLSDTANTNRMQSYAQGVYYGKNKPSRLDMGPNSILFVQQDDDSQNQAKFEFATPSPDLTASMDLLDRALNIHLTSEDVDPKVLNSKGDLRTFTSGFERLLAMYEKFDAAKDDLKAYADAEQWVFQMLSKWSNAFQGTTGNPLRAELQKASIPEDATMQCAFAKPEFIQTKDELEDSSLKLYEAGVKSIVDVVKEVYAVDEEKAIQLLEKMIVYKKQFAELQPIQPPMDVTNLSTEERTIERGRVA